MAFVLVTKPKGGVGKTTLTASLALTAQNSGHHVALIDLDRQRSLSRFAELANIPYQSGLPLGPRKFAKHDAIRNDAIRDTHPHLDAIRDTHPHLCTRKLSEGLPFTPGQGHVQLIFTQKTTEATQLPDSSQSQP